MCTTVRAEDKGKEKPNSASQESSAEVDPFLPKPGVAPAAPASSSKNMNGAANTVTESEEEKAKKLLYCSLCKVAVNSLSQLEAHNTGSKHKTMVEARNGAGPIKSYPRPGSRMKVQNGSKGSGLQNKTFHCEICDVHVNSEIQLKQCSLQQPLLGLFFSKTVNIRYIRVSEEDAAETECCAGCQEPGAAEYGTWRRRSGTAAFERLQLRDASWNREKDDFMAVFKNIESEDLGP
ncbi:hypothetical protein DUI87_04388 [Hirundo rustica rustica]|uniref:U1-type domain-containing protein n=1 Tax=Hirundo rustica rustica TaxID=333673 RepID=A0A3M0KYY0_HIRRU|nr:hypothetical protein DUI87_04388 [Hirundo rustica rustica]